MSTKSTLPSTDSQNPPTLFSPRPWRQYWLTNAALVELEENRLDDEYAFTCEVCQKSLSDCTCGTGQE